MQPFLAPFPAHSWSRSPPAAPGKSCYCLVPVKCSFTHGSPDSPDSTETGMHGDIVQAPPALLAEPSLPLDPQQQQYYDHLPLTSTYQGSSSGLFICSSGPPADARGGRSWNGRCCLHAAECTVISVDANNRNSANSVTSMPIWVSVLVLVQQLDFADSSSSAFAAPPLYRDFIDGLHIQCGACNYV